MTRRRYKLVQDHDDPVVRRQQGARRIIVIAVVLDILLGMMFASVEHIHVVRGLYWAECEATTVGNGYEPHTFLGQVIKAAVGISVIPLFAATFSIFTTALTATHVRHAENQIKAHVTHEKEAIKRHLGSKEHG